MDLDVGGIDFGDDEQEAQGEIDWGNGEIQVESAGSREGKQYAIATRTHRKIPQNR